MGHQGRSCWFLRRESKPWWYRPRGLSKRGKRKGILQPWDNSLLTPLTTSSLFVGVFVTSSALNVCAHTASERLKASLFQPIRVSGEAQDTPKEQWSLRAASFLRAPTLPVKTEHGDISDTRAERAPALQLLLTQLGQDEHSGLANYLRTQPGKRIQLPHGNFLSSPLVPSAVFDVTGVYFISSSCPKVNGGRTSREMIQLCTAAGTWKSLSCWGARGRCWGEKDIQKIKGKYEGTTGTTNTSAPPLQLLKFPNCDISFLPSKLDIFSVTWSQKIADSIARLLLLKQKKVSIMQGTPCFVNWWVN